MVALADIHESIKETLSSKYTLEVRLSPFESPVCSNGFPQTILNVNPCM